LKIKLKLIDNNLKRLFKSLNLKFKPLPCIYLSDQFLPHLRHMSWKTLEALCNAIICAWPTVVWFTQRKISFLRVYIDSSICASNVSFVCFLRPRIILQKGLPLPAAASSNCHIEFSWPTSCIDFGCPSNVLVTFIVQSWQ